MTLPCGFRVFLRCPEERIFTAIDVFEPTFYQHKLLLLFFHLDSVLILYTIIRHHDEKTSWRKIDSWKTVLARKQLRRAIIRTPELKQPLKTTKDAQMIKKFFLFLLLTTVERDRYKVAPILLIIPYIVTIFFYKKDTTHRNVFISLFPFFY